MANKETAALTAATDIVGTEIFHGVQGGNSRKFTFNQVLAFIVGAAVRQLAKSAFGATMGVSILEQELTMTGASVSSTTAQIPARSICLGVASRTTLAVTGAPSYGVGIAGEATKFGGAFSVALGSNNVGVIEPTAFYSDTPVVVTPTSGTFTAGKVRISIYVLTFGAPTS